MEKKFVGMKIIPTISFDELQNLKDQLKKIEGFEFLIRAAIKIS